MLKYNDDLFVSNVPSLDLHGETRYTAISPLKSFIDDNVHLKRKKICIIHGKGNGVLKKTVHDYLKKDTRVINFYVGFFNQGVTIAELQVDKS